MKAGRLAHVVTVQTRSTGIDSLGQQLTTWSNLFTDFAEIRPMSGREMFAAQAVQSEVTHTISMRYRPEWGVGRASATYRILVESRVFDVHAVMDQDMRGSEVKIMASEGLTNG